MAAGHQEKHTRIKYYCLQIRFTENSKIIILKKVKEKPLKSAFQKAIYDIIQNPYVGDPKTTLITATIDNPDDNLKYTQYILNKPLPDK